MGLVFRLMSQFRGLPIVRTEAYTPQAEINEETPLRFWLQMSLSDGLSISP